MTSGSIRTRGQNITQFTPVAAAGKDTNYANLDFLFPGNQREESL
jgi:hypothetical protein